MTHKELKEYLLSYPDSWVGHPFEKNMSAYKVGPKEGEKSTLFAVVEDESKPINVSLRCDPILAKSLRETYETIQAGRNLDRKHWNTIVCSGQLPDDQIKDLVRLSYNLAAGKA